MGWLYIVQKIGFLKKHHKEWNASIFGNLITQLKLAKEELHHLDLLAKFRELLDDGRSRRAELRESLWKLSKRF